MKKLIIIIGCAFAAQLQADDDIDIQIQTNQIKRAIADQGKEIVRAIENTQPKPNYGGSLSPTQINQEYEKLEAARVAKEAAGLKEVFDKWKAELEAERTARVEALKTLRLEAYEKAKATVPAGYVIDPPNADGTITASKIH